MEKIGKVNFIDERKGKKVQSINSENELVQMVEKNTPSSSRKAALIGSFFRMRLNLA